jgi:DNA recombination protein RmuC
LFLSSYKENVMLASPSTLLIILRTIQKIWQFEYQNQNTQKIADHAGKLHTKFCNFVEELEKIGKHLHNGVSAWENSKKALSTGRGNLITQVQKLEAMGVPSKKTLPKHLVDSALLAEETIMIDQKDSAESNLLT